MSDAAPDACPEVIDLAGREEFHSGLSESPETGVSAGGARRKILTLRTGVVATHDPLDAPAWRS